MSWRRTIALLLITILAGCAGGSGSSGFDISPSVENAAIDMALASGHCVTENETIYCPAIEGSPTIPPTPVHDPAVNGAYVQIGRGEVDITSCDNRGICTLDVTLRLENLPSGSVYQIAVRSADPTHGWLLAPVAPAPSVDSTAREAVSVSADEARAQVAVLVYFDGVGSAVGEVATLAETGADAIFLTR